jgi:hypothetical protein
MSVSILIQTDDQATKVVAEVRDALSRDDVKRVMGRAIVQALKAHFNRLDVERANSLGGGRTHFYRRASSGVQQPEMLSDGLKVSINKTGIAQRYFGGTITAGQSGSGKKFLTIPARAEAYGKRAGEFHNLRVLFGAGGKPVALVERDAAAVQRTRKGIFKERGEVGGGIFFWLVKSVFQKPDPSVLPTADEMVTPALNAATAYMQRLWARQAGGAI